MRGALQCMYIYIRTLFLSVDCFILDISVFSEAVPQVQQQKISEESIPNYPLPYGEPKVFIPPENPFETPVPRFPFNSEEILNIEKKPGTLMMESSDQFVARGTAYPVAAGMDRRRRPTGDTGNRRYPGATDPAIHSTGNLRFLAT